MYNTKIAIHMSMTNLFIFVKKKKAKYSIPHESVGYVSSERGNHYKYTPCVT